MMFDIKWINENPKIFDAAMSRRGLKPVSAALKLLDSERKEAKIKAQDIQTERNIFSKEIGLGKSRGDDVTEIMAKVAKTKQAQTLAETVLTKAENKLRDTLASLPNIPLEDVPDGEDEGSNKEIRRIGKKPIFNFDCKDHVEIGESLGMMDFASASKLAGARFVVLKGGLARLERALANYMLDHNTEIFQYSEINPPALVNDAALFGTGQLPKFGDDLFRTESGFWLIPTAEVPLTNLVSGQTLSIDSLPRRYTAMTWCFRSEAGAAGKDTRGMIRQHQFTKVEMVSIVSPEESCKELERMTQSAEDILIQLGLPFRTVVLCAGDMGSGAQKTYDIEVWLPGQNKYREISSCSSCGEYQARRMNTRFSGKDGKIMGFVHTLNGSGLAVGRTLVAILENFQQPDGSVVIPQVLRPYMNNLEVLSPNDNF